MNLTSDFMEWQRNRGSASGLSWRRSMSLGALFALQLFSFAHTAASADVEKADKMISAEYPATKRDNVVDDHFGRKVTDPYRWLENDVRTDKQVAAWVEAQNKITTAYLSTLPGRDIFKARLKRLSTY